MRRRCVAGRVEERGRDPRLLQRTPDAWLLTVWMNVISAGLDGARTRASGESELTSSILSQIIRTFQHRIALAAFKASRGWQDVTLDVIEPHLEQEAKKRRIAEEREAAEQQQGQAQRQHQSRHQDMQLQMQMELQQQQQQHQDEQQRVQQQSMRGGPSNVNGNGGMMGPPKSLKRVRGGSLANASMANTTMYEPPRHFGGSNEDHYAASFSPHAHTSPYQSVASTSTLQPSAYLMGSPYQGQGSPAADSHRHKRRPSDFTSPQRASQSSHVQPSPRTSSKHAKSRSISKLPANDNGVTLSDPSFSSFVDAATALTGLSRAPSEATLPGSNSDEEQRAGVEGTAAVIGSTGPRSGSPPFRSFSPFSTAALPISSTASTTFLQRPRTPERGSVEKGKGPENTSDAAELMLFLAASPSPAQGRREPTLGATSAGMKGRRLFSGMDDSHQPASGSHFSSHNPPTTTHESFEYESKPLLLSPSPSTPSRDRTLTANSFGNGVGWDTYLNVNVNVSPSPGRGTGGREREREFGVGEKVSVDGRGW